ncbi:uncharacterized protein Dana_GF26897 [Drosophila ananassae]|uniref:Uncharacterized protein n=1 Tax=Drosophila ananassae TaxID=7217 RepID=A0A0N8NZ62_DROAN|nr:uncharacterized protein Dana_GF26897 [Drosophila ananassae]
MTQLRRVRAAIQKTSPNDQREQHLYFTSKTSLRTERRKLSAKGAVPQSAKCFLLRTDCLCLGWLTEMAGFNGF